MSQPRIARLIVISATVVFALTASAGSKTVSIKLSGTRGTAFEGHYKVAGTVITVTGTLPARIEVGKEVPEAWEFSLIGRRDESDYLSWAAPPQINTSRRWGAIDFAEGRRYEILE
jgi:hypothetical protein